MPGDLIFSLSIVMALLAYGLLPGEEESVTVSAETWAMVRNSRAGSFSDDGNRPFREQSF